MSTPVSVVTKSLAKLKLHPAYLSCFLYIRQDTNHIRKHLGMQKHYAYIPEPFFNQVELLEKLTNIDPKPHVNAYMPSDSELNSYARPITKAQAAKVFVAELKGILRYYLIAYGYIFVTTKLSIPPAATTLITSTINAFFAGDEFNLNLRFSDVAIDKSLDIILNSVTGDFNKLHAMFLVLLSRGVRSVTNGEVTDVMDLYKKPAAELFRGHLKSVNNNQQYIIAFLALCIAIQTILFIYKNRESIPSLSDVANSLPSKTDLRLCIDNSIDTLLLFLAHSVAELRMPGSTMAHDALIYLRKTRHRDELKEIAYADTIPILSLGLHSPTINEYTFNTYHVTDDGED